MASKEANDEIKNDFEITKLNKLRRLPKRGIFDKEKIYKILDEAIWCFVGFNIDLNNMNCDNKEINNMENQQQLQPCVIPTFFGRKDDFIYIHGSSISRMIKTLTYSDKVPLCLTVALFKSFVLAKSAFHHSANYKSVVIYGNGKLICDKKEKLNGLKIISQHILPNRWDLTRLPTDQELKITSVIKIKINYISAKQRNGDPDDDKKDLKLPIWSGLLPINKIIDKPIPDKYTKEMNLKIPHHIQEWEMIKWGKKLKKDPNDIYVNNNIIFMFCTFLVLFIAIWKAPI